MLATRAAGLPSRSVIKSAGSSGYKLFDASEFDRVLDLDGVPSDALHWAALCDLLRHGDIWFAYFDSHFFPITHRRVNEIVLLLIRLLGIRIIVMAHGMDVLHRMRSVTRFDWVSRAQKDYPDWDLTAATPDVRWRIALFSRRADTVIADPIAARFIPRCDLNFKWLAVDCSALKPIHRIANSVPVVAHAPQHRYTKGTDHLLRAVEDLQSKGLEFELRLIERLSRTEALEAYASADIIADQFVIGSYGMFALEGMALGKPVLAYLDEEHLGNPVYNLPIVNTNPDNIREVLAVLLSLPVLRERIGRSSRDAVLRFHSVERMSEVWRTVSLAVWQGRSPIFEDTTHFGQRRTSRAFSEDPADSQFWPVPVSDIYVNILQSLQQTSNRPRSR